MRRPLRTLLPSILGLILFAPLATGCMSEMASLPDAPRVAKGALPGGVNSGREQLYCYYDPLDPGHYANVFQLGDGQYAITLRAKSRDGMYAGDELSIWAVQDSGHVRG